jgi:hypothetical protein
VVGRVYSIFVFSLPLCNASLLYEYSKESPGFQRCLLKSKYIISNLLYKESCVLTSKD